MLKRLLRLRHGSGGFTLIELLVVATILSILISIALLQFKNYHERSANTAALSDLRNVESRLQAYYADFKRYP